MNLNGNVSSTSSNDSFPKNISLKWLFENIPVEIWVKAVGVVLTAFFLGSYASGFPMINNMLSYLPGYKSPKTLPHQTVIKIENEIEKLIESHNVRQERLHDQLIQEEKLAGGTFYYSEREPHQQAAKRFEEHIKNENEEFRRGIEAIKMLTQ